MTDVSRREMLRTGLLTGALAAHALLADWPARMQAALASVGGRSSEELATDENFWFNVQQAFAIDRSFINLNNGGCSPSSRVALDAFRRYMEFANNAPVRNMWLLQDPQVEGVRAALARAFGCKPAEMAITRNASEALQTLIFGMDLKAGDEVVTTELDYPRMLNAYRQRVARDGIVLKQIPLDSPPIDRADIIARIADAITPRTKAILVSHVVFLTGEILPVAEICVLGKRENIPVIVDGAHAFAHLNYVRAELECEYYATSLHKWLATPVGAGFLHVQQERIAGLWPLMAGPDARSADIRKFEEIGTHSAAHRLCVAEALNFHNTIGAARKEARLRMLKERWALRLAQNPRVRFMTGLSAENSCGLATFTIKDIDPVKLSEHLWARHKIVVVAVAQANVTGLRVSPNVYTTTDEIDRFAEAIEDVLVHGLPA